MALSGVEAPASVREPRGGAAGRRLAGGAAHRELTAVALALLASLLAGCAVGDLLEVRGSQKILAEQSYLGGTVQAADGSDGWLVVLVATFPCDEDWSVLRDAVARGENPAQSADPETRAVFARARGKLQLVSHTLLQRPGRWYAGLVPGCYAVGAFQDLNRDQRYSDEPALIVMHPEQLVELAPGQRVDGLRLSVPRDGRFALDSLDPLARQTADLAVRTHEDQTFVSLDQVAVEGKVVDLADPRFGAESGKLGFIDVYDFAWKLGPGVYFLEPYDPNKIPVLFVHGALGYPQQFAKLIEGLDRARFQPWFFFYPSGARLEAVAHFLTERIARLEARYGFPEMAVVAHSMGGLVSRRFLLEHHARVETDSIRLFVSYSTPWEGVASARMGVERSPVVIDSWRDVAAGSDFIQTLFFAGPERKQPRQLPGSIAYHLVFGVKDETISVPSAIPWQVVREAKDRWPLPYGHVDILASPEASLLLNEMLVEIDD
jgi:pimeloyl-ACP methyl ester carboxylesterase